MFVDQEIYRRFYEEAKNLGIVWTLNNWAVKQGLFDEEEIETDDAAYCDWEEQFEHAHAVRTVLACQLPLP